MFSPVCYTVKRSREVHPFQLLIYSLTGTQTNTKALRTHTLHSLLFVKEAEIQQFGKGMRGWRQMSGPWPACPSEGIRFDWIGPGDLCIKLRLPSDPMFCREIQLVAGVQLMSCK